MDSNMGKRIFYTTTYSPSQINEWSGLGYNIYSMLQRQGFEIDTVSPLAYKPSSTLKILSRINRKLILPREKSVVKNYAMQVENVIRNENGIVFSPSTLPVAYYKGHNPVVIYTDATFALMVNYYDEFKNWTPRAIKVANDIEKTALDRADLLLYASDWAAHSAINDYGIKPSKVKVVPFGANILDEYDFDTIITSIKYKLTQPLELLFIGVDWERKGGQRVLDVFMLLKSKGINVHLSIAGPTKNPLKEPISGVSYYGFLNKNNLDDAEVLKRLFLNAHFFVMLSTSECYGLVYCEANACGTPVIGFNTGGVPAIITESNGALVEVNSTTEEICKTILELYHPKQRYYDLCVSSYKKFIEKLNWKTSGSKIKQLLDTL